MKVWKKLSAVTLALVMSLALCVPAFATVATTNPASLATGTVNDEDRTGQQGTFETADTPIVQGDKTVTLAKEITAYNPDTVTVKAPTISYTYTIAGAAVAENTTTFTLTDKANKHADGVGTIEVPVKSGVGDVTVNAGSTANTGTVSWTSADDVLSASSEGVANYKSITFNFSGIDFGASPGTGAGVYRYAVTETLTTASNANYAATGVTETTGTHIRYIDVYVKDAAQPGETPASKWDIYGFTCFYNNGTITESNKNTVAVKTTGFVTGTSNGSTVVPADKYYTYNLTVSKTVENDNYSAQNHAFPFTVLFTNNNIKTNVGIMTDTTSAVSASGFIGTNNVIPGNFDSEGDTTLKGVLNIYHGTTMKYVGIPCGTSVEVYETNDVNGVTYKVETTVDNAATPATDVAVTSTNTTPTSPVAQAESKEAYQSTKATFNTTINTPSTNHSIAIKNILLNISPTGVTLRYAPYLAMLGAGIVALPLSLRKKEEDF